MVMKALLEFEQSFLVLRAKFETFKQPVIKLKDLEPDETIHTTPLERPKIEPNAEVVYESFSIQEPEQKKQPVIYQ